jgi:predicted nucleic acid-binding protein
VNGGRMKIIDFNNPSFSGFEPGEDILIDTGIILGFYNKFDAYYTTITNLFQNHILNNDNNMFLYINPTVINEINHLAKTPLKQYLKRFPNKSNSFSSDDVQKLTSNIIEGLKELIENDVLLILDGDKESTLKQIELSAPLGAVDAVNASIANLYNTSFLTVDRALTDNIVKVQSELPNIKTIYYTTGRNRDY